MDTIEYIIREELADSLQQAPPPRSSAVWDGLIWLTVAEIAKRTNRHERDGAQGMRASELHGTQDSKGAWWRAHMDCVMRGRNDERARMGRTLDWSAIRQHGHIRPWLAIGAQHSEPGDLHGHAQSSTANARPDVPAQLSTLRSRSKVG